MLLGLLLASGVGFVAANSSFFFSNAIYPGIEAAGVPVGGLSVEEAASAIDRVMTAKLKAPVLTIQHEGRRWTVPDKAIALEVDPLVLAQKAHAIGRTGSLVQQFQDRYQAAYQGYSLSLQHEYSEEKLRDALQQIARTINRSAASAKLEINGRHRTITPEVHGKVVDEPAALERAKQTLAAGLGKVMDLPVLIKPAAIAASDLKDVVDLLASYTTSFGLKDQNRVQNVYLAAETLDEALVRPGEIFSYNQHIGERTAAAGYKPAPSYIGDELVPDIGGGICQVSTTLYNAVLLADQEIVERSSHIHPVAYAPLGQDATVSYGALDFKFKNTLRHPVYIRSTVHGNQLTISVYGKHTADMPEIEILSAAPKVVEPKIIVKQDETLPLGQQKVEKEGQKGYEVDTFRIRYRSGQQISKELLAHDEYPVTDKVVVVGSKVPDTEKKLQKP